jgi:hypothetical protein
LKKYIPFLFLVALAKSSFALENVRVIGPVAISTHSTVSVSFATGSTTTVQGTDAHDAAVTGKPVLFGVYASTNMPTAVSLGDVSRVLGDHFGRLVVLTGSSYPEVPDTTHATAAGETVCISSPGANLSLYINKVTLHNAGATNVTVSLLDGSGGTTLWKGELASEGGAAGISFGARGWKLSENVNLVASLSGDGDVDVNVTEFYIGPSTP